LASALYSRDAVQVSTIEFSLVEVSVLHGLKQGNEVLKQIHKELNVESVEKLLEETAEAREYQRVCSSCSLIAICVL
jgi:charged multivesicular body protein 6